VSSPQREEPVEDCAVRERVRALAGLAEEIRARPCAQPVRLVAVDGRGALRAYPEDMAHERITIDPGKMSGLPCIRDTRVTVSAVLGQLATGRSTDEILIDYPYLERADILAALEFAAAAVQERELPLAQPA
jgi:uncharacterized protein (DUF433 family)